MLALLNQINTPVLIVAAIVIMAANTWFLKWFLGKIQSEPADDEVEAPLPTPAVSTSTSPLLVAKPTGNASAPSSVGVAAEPEAGATRITVGTPRAKPLQPVEPSLAVSKTAEPAPVRLASLSAPETTPDSAEVGRLADKSASVLPAIVPEPALAAVGTSTASKDPEIRTAISLTKDRGTASGTSGTALAGTLAGTGTTATPSASLTTLPDNKSSEKPTSAPAAASPSDAEDNLNKTINDTSRFAPGISATDAPASGKVPEPIFGTALPKLNLTKESIAPAAATPSKVEVKPLISNKDSLGIAPTASLISVDNSAIPLASVTTPPKPNVEVAAPEVKTTPKLEEEQMPKPPAKSQASEPSPASAGLITISNKPAVKPEASLMEKEQLASARSGLIAIPVKDGAEATTPASGGLMLMPDAPAAIDKSAEAFAAPIASPQKTKLMGRPRIFLPANQPAAAPASEPVENKIPAALAAEVEVPTPAPEAAPTIVPSQPDLPAPSAPEAPTPSEPAFPTTPEVESPAEPTPETTPQAIVEEPAASAFVGESYVAPAKEGTVSITEAAPTHTALSGSFGLSHLQSEVSEAEPKSAATPETISAQELPVAAVELEQTPELIVAPAPEPAHTEKRTTHFAEPIVPVAVPAAAPYIQPVPIHTPRRPAMAQNENTTSQAPGGRASAQLTLGFEITSLQLTPFFKLGAVQLRPLSNIVSLHLINAQQADNPLAAGISFQIDNVELDGASHIRSILLKPQPTATPATTPQPKLQVDNVQFSQATEGAPIQITSSQATSTAVQLLATCTIAAMDFTPSFEIGSLRLEPDSNFVMLRLAPSSRPAALDLPPSFEVAAVQLEGESQISTVRLVPGSAPK